MDQESSIGVGQIIKASWNDVLKLRLGGNPFASKILNAAVLVGRLRIVTLGECVKYEGAKYNIEQLSIPVTWTLTDNLNSENNKITIAATMIKNAIRSHDDLLIGQLEKSKLLIVSKQYKYGCSDLYTSPKDSIEYLLVWTAYCPIPLDIQPQV